MARNRGAGPTAAIALLATCALWYALCAFVSAGGATRCVKRVPTVSRFSRGGGANYEVGDKVKAMSAEDEQWYVGRITSDNNDGSWVVTWDDPDGGDPTEIVREAAMKKIIIFKDYKVGDDCRAISPDDDRWYEGSIAEVLGDDKFKVKWDDPGDGDETANIEAEYIRKMVVFKAYKQNDEVLASFPDDGQMYDATVVGENVDGTFQVKWADPDGGPEESAVSPKKMKYPPISFDSLEIGQRLQGIVVMIAEFGAFVDVNVDTGEGLLHISQISRERVNDINEYLEEGQEVDVFIQNLRDDGKFGLTLFEDRVGSGGGGGGHRGPVDLTPFSEVSPDDWLVGRVKGIQSYGCFVDVTLDGEMASGLVHISQVTDGFVDNIEDHVSVGQEVKVRVTDVDMDRGKLSLSMRDSFNRGGGGGGAQREPTDWSAFEGIDPTEWITGTVQRTTSFGAFVKIKAPSGEEGDGLVHITQIRDGFVESVEAELESGQSVQVRVLSVDADGGKLSLTMKNEGMGDDGGGEY